MELSMAVVQPKKKTPECVSALLSPAETAKMLKGMM